MHRHARLCLLRAILPLLALCAWSPEDSQAFIHYDFEQPYWVEDIGNQCKDHALLKVDGVYHVFYIHSLPPESGDNLRKEKWFGHLISEDLRHWTRLDSVLSTEEVPNTWEEKFVWAPKIIRHPWQPNWVMFYTGVNNAIAQRAGMAWSFDLFQWNRWPLNPVYTPGPWADWQENNWANCRDPEIFQHEGLAEYYMLNTASMNDGRGAISAAVSQNLVDWSDLGAFFVNDSPSVLESVQLVYDDNLYHLFFTEQGVQGTSHMTSPDLWDGWTKDNLTLIDVGNAPEITHLAGETVFSRHDALLTPDDLLYYFRFDHIDFDTPDGVPQVVSLGGLQDHWHIVFGNAFDNQPTWGDNPYMRGDASSNMQGNSFIATYENYPSPDSGEAGSSQGHSAVGVLASDPFTVTGNRISMLVGGGNSLSYCFVGLVNADTDSIYFRETGQNSFQMEPRIWDVSTLIGGSYYIVVADMGSTLPWHHISVDDIREYEAFEPDPLTPAQPEPQGTLRDFIDDDAMPNTSIPLPRESAGRLLAPQPNPFNPKTHLRYELDREGQASLIIFDASGRLVRRLFGGRLPAGPGFFTWDGRDDSGRSLPSGSYFARMQFEGNTVASRKLVLIR